MSTTIQIFRDGYENGLAWRTTDDPLRGDEEGPLGDTLGEEISAGTVYINLAGMLTAQPWCLIDSRPDYLTVTADMPVYDLIDKITPMVNAL